MSRDGDTFHLRLAPETRQRVKEAAKSGDYRARSMNQWILDAIEAYFVRENEREDGWRWVEPKHQIDTGLLGELEAIEHDPDGGVPTSVSINSAISRYVLEYFGDDQSRDWEDAEFINGTLVTKEEHAALRDEMTDRMGRIEKLLIELAGERS